MNLIAAARPPGRRHPGRLVRQFVRTATTEAAKADLRREPGTEEQDTTLRGLVLRHTSA
jgi:hypothetical protein